MQCSRHKLPARVGSSSHRGTACAPVWPAAMPLLLSALVAGLLLLPAAAAQGDGSGNGSVLAVDPQQQQDPTAPLAGDTVTPQIVGGTKSPDDRFRFVVGYITDRYRKACTGALIREDAFVTSATCIKSVTNIKIWVGLNSTFFRYFPPTKANDAFGNFTPLGDPDYTRVRRRVTYPEYKSGKNGTFDDLTIVFLPNTNAVVAKGARPVQIATMDDFLGAKLGTMAAGGFGTTSIGADPSTGLGGLWSRDLRYALMRYVDSGTPGCREIISDKESQFCAGLVNATGKGDLPYQGPCTDDTSAPLVWSRANPNDPLLDGLFDTDPYQVVVGLMVNNSKTCGLGKPAYFTNLALYRDWIYWNIDQVVKPGRVYSMMKYAQVSTTATWFAIYEKTKRMGPADTIDKCEKECTRLSLSNTGPGCSTFSVVYLPVGSGPATTRNCAFFGARLPLRLCGPGDTKYLCKYASGGSWRFYYLYY